MILVRIEPAYPHLEVGYPDDNEPLLPVPDSQHQNESVLSDKAPTPLDMVTDKAWLQELCEVGS